MLLIQASEKARKHQVEVTRMASWEEKAAAKRADLLACIPQAWRLTPDDMKFAQGQRDLTNVIPKFLTEDEKAIVNLDSVPIVEAIQSKKLTALEVAKAFCKTAAIIHQVNPCLLEIFFEEALTRAKELDEYQAAHGKTTGPMHGLPVSLKDQFHVKGVATSMGYVGSIGKNHGLQDESQTLKVESEITKELLSCGAVLYCKTSLPQTVYLGETENNIIGRTVNPHNREVSCGGSSGGEATLIALRGSTLGVGTDIAGSVRIPAAFSGIFSLKPTPQRVSYKDCANTAPGQTTYPSTVGFMASSLDALDLALKSTLSTQPWLRDPVVVPLPYRPDVMKANKPLKIGIHRHNGLVRPHPPVERGMELFTDAIKKAGHKVVDWNPPSPAKACDLHDKFLLSDGLADIHDQLSKSGEPLLPQLQAGFPLVDPHPLLDIHQFTVEAIAEEIKFSDYWNSTADDDGQVVDAVIMPGAAHAGVIPGKYYHLAYSRLINFLGYSAVVVPITKADKAVDVAEEGYKPLNEEDRLNWEAYDASVYHGSPVGLQIVCRKFEEEKALAIAKTLYQDYLNSQK